MSPTYMPQASLPSPSSRASEQPRIHLHKNATTSQHKWGREAER